MRVVNLINSFKYILLLVLVASLQSCDNGILERKININSGWKYKLLPESETSDEKFVEILFNDDSWKNVCLPHTANIEPLLVNDQWQGICWYRKSFQVPSHSQGKKITLELDAAMNHSKIWINETLSNSPLIL